MITHTTDFLKFQIYDLEKARDTVQWLMKNVGPQIASSGSIIRGEGWTIWVTLGGFGITAPHVNVELDAQHIDEHTMMMFMLKWS